MENFIVDLGILLIVAGILSVLAVYMKQPVIIAYILTGMLIGPWGLAWVPNVDFIEVISHLGITLLLFLAGLNLHPRRLIELFRRTAIVTFINCAASFIIAYGVAHIIGFKAIECLCIGLALMYSSTILVVKLMPTTELHHKHMGAVCIGVLILQDLLAVAVLAFVRCLGTAENPIISFSVISLNLVLFVFLLFVFDKFILKKVMVKVDRLHEVLFMLGLAWCFGIATISYKMGLFFESGAFFAGVVMAQHPVSRFIAEKLKPLRDFFLVLFFFALGAKLNLDVMKSVMLPACLLSVVFIFIKPIFFQKSFEFLGETRKFSKEAGIRLGQLSEFSLLVAFLAMDLALLSNEAFQFIQVVTIITFIISSYIIIFKYPTPIGVTEGLIRD